MKGTKGTSSEAVARMSAAPQRLAYICCRINMAFFSWWEVSVLAVVDGWAMVRIADRNPYVVKEAHLHKALPEGVKTGVKTRTGPYESSAAPK